MLTYETAFEKLKEETGEEDTGKIVDIFISREDENFSLYNYLQNVHASIMQTESELANTEEQTHRYLQDEEGNNNQRQSKLKEIERRRDDLHEKNLHADNEFQDISDSINLWCAQIESFLIKIFKSGITFKSSILNEPAENSLLAKLKDLIDKEDYDLKGLEAKIVNDTNVLPFLAILEQCIHEIQSRFMASNNVKSVEYGPTSPKKADLTMSLDIPDFSNEEEENNRVDAAPISSDAMRVGFEAQMKLNLRKSRSQQSISPTR